MRYQALLVVAALSPTMPARSEDLPRALKPVVVWTGTDSKQAKESFACCRSQAEWEASWNKHQGRDEKAEGQPCPQVDFDTHMVIVLFHGESSQNHGIDVVSVSEERECVRLRYRPSWYQVGVSREGAAGPPRSHATQSYAFVVLPRSRKAVVLEEDIQHYIGKPPEWEERAKLAASTDR
jgi:hypothetical protein